MGSDVAIVGYGVRLRAAAGTELGRAPTNDDLLVGAWGGSGHVHDRLVSVRDGVASVSPSVGARVEGFTWEPNENGLAAAWSIELPRFSCAWPRGLALRVLPQQADRSEFELAGGRDGVVFLRGPLRGSQVPAPADLVGAGQQVVRSDMRPHARWIETRYEYSGRKWRQRHRYAVSTSGTVVLVTAKAPDGKHEWLFAALDEIAASIRVFDVAKDRGREAAVSAAATR